MVLSILNPKQPVRMRPLLTPQEITYRAITSEFAVFLSPIYSGVIVPWHHILFLFPFLSFSCFSNSFSSVLPLGMTLQAGDCTTGQQQSQKELNQPNQIEPSRASRANWVVHNFINKQYATWKCEEGKRERAGSNFKRFQIFSNITLQGKQFSLTNDY